MVGGYAVDPSPACSTPGVPRTRLLGCKAGGVAVCCAAATASDVGRSAPSREGAAAASTAGGRVVLLADLDQVDGPRESRLVGVRRVTATDEHAPFGIEPALEVVVHVCWHRMSTPPYGALSPRVCLRSVRRWSHAAETQ
jgi:hypothetical protein